MIDYNNVRLRRVLVWSGDRAPGGSLNSYTIQLPCPIEHVIRLEWLNASAELQGLLLHLEDWGTATTSQGRRYWRFLDSASNQRYIGDWQTALGAYHAPTTLRILQISLWNRDGTAASIDSDHSVELEVYAVSDPRLAA